MLPPLDRTRAGLHRLPSKALVLKREVVEKMGQLATAAFGLVAALAWNNAIQSAFARVYPAPTGGAAMWPLIAYATLVTLVAVVVILLIGRAAGRLKDETRLI